MCRNSIPATFTSSIAQTLSTPCILKGVCIVHDVKVVGMEFLYWQAWRRHMIWILYENLIASFTSCYMTLVHLHPTVFQCLLNHGKDMLTHMLQSFNRTHLTTLINLTSAKAQRGANLSLSRPHLTRNNLELISIGGETLPTLFNFCTRLK